MADRVNAYTCNVCGLSIYTFDRDEGTTPMFLACRATPGCRGRSVSNGYPSGPPPQLPTWEWYRPPKNRLYTFDDEMRDYIRRGGLVLRRIGDAIDG